MTTPEFGATNVSSTDTQRFRLVITKGREYPGRTFEEFEVGQEFSQEEFPSQLVDEIKIKIFGVLTGDENALHTDPAFCAETSFKRIVAQGLLTLSFVAGLVHHVGLWQGTCVGFTEIENAKFLRPVYSNDELFLKASVVKKSEGTVRGLVTFLFTISNQNKEEVLTVTLGLHIAKNDFFKWLELKDKAT